MSIGITDKSGYCLGVAVSGLLGTTFLTGLEGLSSLQLLRWIYNESGLNVLLQ